MGEVGSQKVIYLAIRWNKKSGLFYLASEEGLALSARLCCCLQCCKEDSPGPWSRGLNLWAPEVALSSLLPIGKCCYYNGKRKREKTERKKKLNNLFSLLAPNLHYSKLHLKGSWVTSLEPRESSLSSVPPGFCVLLRSRRWWNVFQNMYV